MKYVLFVQAITFSGYRWDFHIRIDELKGNPKEFKADLSMQDEICASILDVGDVRTFKRLDVMRAELFFKMYPNQMGQALKCPLVDGFVSEWNEKRVTAVASVTAAVTDVSAAVPALDPALIVEEQTTEIQPAVCSKKTDTEVSENTKLLRVIAENTGKTAENTGKTAENTTEIKGSVKGVSRTELERMEAISGKDYRRFWQAKISTRPMTAAEIWEWENPGRSLDGMNSEDRIAELNPIYKSISEAGKKYLRGKPKK